MVDLTSGTSESNQDHTSDDKTTDEKKPAPKKKAKVPTVSKSDIYWIPAEILAQFPWLAKTTEPVKTSAGISWQKKWSIKPGDDVDPEDDELEDVLEKAIKEFVETEEDELMVHKSFEEKRDEWAMSELGRFGKNSFKVTVRGVGQGDKPFAELRGYASGQRAIQWTKMYHLTETADFALSLWSEAECSVLAAAWCDRRAYFYTLWLGQEDEKYAFTPADIEGWSEPREMADLRPTLTDKQRKRVDAVFKPVPRR